LLLGSLFGMIWYMDAEGNIWPISHETHAVGSLVGAQMYLISLMYAHLDSLVGIFQGDTWGGTTLPWDTYRQNQSFGARSIVSGLLLEQCRGRSFFNSNLLVAFAFLNRSQ